MWSPMTKLAMVSNIGISRRWPRPVRSRCTRARADRADRVQADDAVDQRVRDIARHAVAGPRHQRRQRGRALDQIVIGGLRRIGTILAEAEHAGIDQARIDLGHHVVAEVEPRHRLRAHVIDQHVGGGDQPQRRVASGRLFQIERERALAAIGVEEHRPHAGMAGRADQAGDVAVERLDLDDFGAVIAEHLGGVGPHQHGGHVDDLDAPQRSHGLRLLPMRPCGAVLSGQVTAARRQDQARRAYGRMHWGL